MNVVGDTANLNRGAIQTFDNSNEISMEFRQSRGIKDRVTVFGAEHEVNYEVGERLRHGVYVYNGDECESECECECESSASARGCRALS